MAFRDVHLSFQHCSSLIEQADNKPDDMSSDLIVGFHSADCDKASSPKNLNTFLAKYKSLEAVGVPKKVQECQNCVGAKTVAEDLSLPHRLPWAWILHMSSNVEELLVGDFHASVTFFKVFFG
jgi:hypothetical protein